MKMMNFMKPKILILCTNSDKAGAPIHVLTIVSELLNKFEFYVVFGEMGPVAEELIALGVKVDVVSQMRSKLSPFNDYLAFVRISEILIRFNPAIIHAHSSKAGMIGRLLCLKHKVPCIYSVHGWGWRGLGLVKKLLVWAIEKVLSFIPETYYIFVSNSVKNEAKKYLGIKSQRSSVIHNGTQDFYLRGENEKKINMLMLARVTRAKDHESLIKAFELCDIDSTLTLAGYGTNNEVFINKAKQWAPNKFNSIRFLGSRDDVAYLLEAANIFLLISHFEALPISVIEAMSACRAIIATDVGGMKELVDHGITGLLVKEGDVIELAAAINLMTDVSYRKKIAKRARKKYLQQFNVETMLSKLSDYYLKFSPRAPNE